MVRIEACKKGDKEALGQLYTVYARKLRGICRHYVKDENTAEDILHDAFIIIFMSIGDLKDDTKLEGWMITIVRNLSIKYLQSREKDIIPLSYLDLEIAEESGEAQPTIALDTLLAAIDALPESSREVFKLSVLDGLSHKEIGELLGIAPHSSSSQLFRAKQMLRTLLINYWALLLLPVFIPLYIYFVTRHGATDLSENRPTVVKVHKKKTQAKDNPETLAARSASKRSAKAAKSGQTDVEIETDSAKQAPKAMFLDTDSLLKQLATGDTDKDSTLRLLHIDENRIMASNQPDSLDIRQKKKYPWTFNLGYSSNAGAGNTLSDLNYLSVTDYANGGAAAKLYTWNDYIEYMNRNDLLLDSIERAKLNNIAINNAGSGVDGMQGEPLHEKAHHHRPLTFGLAVNKQLSRRWTFSTGMTYTRLKSEFTSEFYKATLQKTQRIDYVGIPFRLTYRIWGKGRFNAYTTGGVTFEMPVGSSLHKEYAAAADSTFTTTENIKARYQWSVNLGLGIQYRIFKPFSLYAEPNMFYYFGNGSGLETYRTEHPFIITVPFGLRLTW